MDFWVLYGVSRSVFNYKWELESPAHGTLLKVLDGEMASLDWGDQGQHVFFKTRHIPVILMVTGDYITTVFNRPSYFYRLALVSWDGICPMGYLDAERIAATVLKYALELPLVRRELFRGNTSPIVSGLYYIESLSRGGTNKKVIK
jgi:hypothetical protein